ncbi:HlyD family secretion protein [Microvirga sp. R24]
MTEMPNPKSFERTSGSPIAESDAVPPEPIKAKPGRWVKRGGVALVLLTTAVAGGFYGHHYWTIGRYEVSTDDAFVEADSTIIAPKVPGYIAEVSVADNQSVKAGQTLARIDDRDLRAALDQARADVAASEAAIRNIDAQIALQRSEIAQAEANVAATQASLRFAEADAARFRDLSRTGAGTLQRAQQTQSVQDQTRAALQRDEAALAVARAKVDVLNTSRAQAEANLRHSTAAARQAELNLSYTAIVAPVNGTVGARSVRLGQYVTVGTQLMAVVPLHAAYVVANFKETQLADVRPGQPVEIEVDGLPGATFRGHVESLSPASGLEFALLPPDNATGNFTKIVQRIPVRIAFDEDVSGRLHAGMSVEPTIDTRRRTGSL